MQKLTAFVLAVSHAGQCCRAASLKYYLGSGFFPTGACVSALDGIQPIGWAHMDASTQ